MSTNLLKGQLVSKYKKIQFTFSFRESEARRESRDIIVLSADYEMFGFTVQARVSLITSYDYWVLT